MGDGEEPSQQPVPAQSQQPTGTASVVVNQPATDASETYWTRRILLDLSSKVDKVLDLLATKADQKDLDHVQGQLEEFKAATNGRFEPLEQWKHASDATERQKESFWTKRNATIAVVCTVMMCLTGLTAVLVSALG